VNNLLEVDRLTVRRSRKPILHSITLSLDANAGIVGLFGENGAGKTTLLQAAAGLITHQEGSIRASDGRVPVLLPDRPYLYDFLRVGECPQVLAGYFSDFAADIAEDIIAELDLKSSKRVGQLSKGMAEQLSLGMMLARRARVYLFDEPLAAVDPVTRDTLLELIRRYRPRDSVMVISTHLIAGLESLFDEFVILHQGRILLHEKTDALRAKDTLEDTVKEAMRNA